MNDDLKRSVKQKSAHIDDECTELILLQSDNLVVTGLLRQFQQSTCCCESQAGHVGFTKE